MAAPSRGIDVSIPPNGGHRRFRKSEQLGLSGRRRQPIIIGRRTGWPAKLMAMAAQGKVDPVPSEMGATRLRGYECTESTAPIIDALKILEEGRLASLENAPRVPDREIRLECMVFWLRSGSNQSRVETGGADPHCEDCPHALLPPHPLGFREVMRGGANLPGGWGQTDPEYSHAALNGAYIARSYGHHRRAAFPLWAWPYSAIRRVDIGHGRARWVLRLPYQSPPPFTPMGNGRAEPAIPRLRGPAAP
jgi:hypothetical protein